MTVSHDYVQRVVTEASLAFSAVGNAMRACAESLSHCGALLGAAQKTHKTAKVWADQVKGVSVAAPPMAATMTDEVETVRLTSAFGGGGIITWTDKVNGADNALTAAKEATQQLTTWAAEATEGYSAAHVHVAGLHTWLESLYGEVGKVHDGATAMANVDASAAIEHLGSVAGWFQTMATEMSERQTAFDLHRHEASQTLRSVPLSYGLVSTALNIAAMTLPSVAENVRQVARDLSALTEQ